MWCKPLFSAKSCASFGVFVRRSRSRIRACIQSASDILRNSFVHNLDGVHQYKIQYASDILRNSFVHNLDGVHQHKSRGDATELLVPALIWRWPNILTRKYISSHKNNCQKIEPAHFVITKRDFILSHSCFCEKYSS